MVQLSQLTENKDETMVDLRTLSFCYVFSKTGEVTQSKSDLILNLFLQNLKRIETK